MREDEHGVTERPETIYSKMKIVKVAFSGPKFCGKDTVVQLLKQEHDFSVFSFSDQLKVIACELFSFMKPDYPSEEKETLIVHVNKETGKQYTPRDVWQALNVLAIVYPDIFVRRLHKQIDNFVTSMYQLNVRNMRICIKDVRMPAELEYVRANGYDITLIDSDDPRCHNELSRHESESHYELIRLHAHRTYFNKKGDPDHLQKMRVLLASILASETKPAVADEWRAIRDEIKRK